MAGTIWSRFAACCAGRSLTRRRGFVGFGQFRPEPRSFNVTSRGPLVAAFMTAIAAPRRSAYLTAPHAGFTDIGFGAQAGGAQIAGEQELSAPPLLSSTSTTIRAQFHTPRRRVNAARQKAADTMEKPAPPDGLPVKTRTRSS